jgi:hypothetical protein
MNFVLKMFVEITYVVKNIPAKNNRLSFSDF